MPRPIKRTTYKPPRGKRSVIPGKSMKGSTAKIRTARANVARSRAALAMLMDRRGPRRNAAKKLGGNARRGENGAKFATTKN